jgi:SAM-dependent methyltransferase
MMDSAEDAKRRLNPRPWDHDYVIMRQMADAYTSLIGRHLGGARNLTVVDYGCGPMPYRPLFAQVAGQYIGADLSDNPDATVVLREDGGLPLENDSVDVIVSSQVLEHVLDVKQYLGECMRVLRKGGVLLLSTHGMWIYHPHPTDVRRWTRWGLRYDVEQSGFRVLEDVACVGPLAYATQLQVLLVKGLLLKGGVVGKALSLPVTLVGQGLMWLQDRITPAWVTNDNASVYVVVARKV